MLDPGELALIDEVLLGAKRRGVDVVRALDAGGWILGRARVRELEGGVLEAYASALEAMSVRDVKSRGREALNALDMKAAIVQFLRDAARAERER